jgi:hypothetical protein
MDKPVNPEEERLKTLKGQDVSEGVDLWSQWGPYVSERGWGTVREDYSADGDAWSYFTHDQARMRTYRRCEDGIAGLSDRYQVLLFAPAFWNGTDPILKERLFGVNSNEGNHGEDVKEYYYHLDATPTHSYLKYLYKYPQATYPYAQLVQENQARGLKDREYELIDTGIFDESRYFDIFIEYAKADANDLCIQIEAFNRGPEAAPLHLLPHLWFRNQWAMKRPKPTEPTITVESESPLCLVADDTNLPSPRLLLFDYHLGPTYLYAPPNGTPLFTNNESNKQALWDQPNDTLYVKDAFHRHLIQGEKGAINPKRTGTKAAIHYFFPSIPPGQSVVLHFRLTNQKKKDPLTDVRQVIDQRKKEADLFYEGIHPPKASAEEKAIQRQAFAGMIWNKQIYIYNVHKWLDGDDPENPPPKSRRTIRNFHWQHIASYRIFSMPDKWEYPWFASWDLAFQTLVFSLIDLNFAKQQLWQLLFDQFQHPNGEIPAYEWEFSDINPPVQAWAALKIFEYEKKKFGREDVSFLKKCFHKLILNFAWWVNKVDSFGNNIFEGGFLGMDNIAVTDRSQKMADGYVLDQADGVGWISLFCLNLTRMALYLAKQDPDFEGLAIKFFQHFVYVAAAMRMSEVRSYDMFHQEDAFFYSHLRYPDGRVEVRPVRSLEGVIPFFACDVWKEEELKQFPAFYKSFEWMIEKRAALTAKCVHRLPNGYFLFGVLEPKEMERFLKYIWDPNEFRSDYGLRSVSKYYEKHPGQMHGLTFSYEPGESEAIIKGGNSNWRGPIWFPINYFLINTLSHLSKAFQDQMVIKVPGESPVTLGQMARSFAARLLNLFKKDANGNRPCFGNCEKLQKDPHFQDYILFYEHFHGDNGRGLGASHQNGWTGLIANLIDELQM